MSSVLLDVLIPTYKRSARVMRSIESLLSVDDGRVNIICSSNCFEPKLERLKGLDARVKYSYFDENRGAIGNLLYLLKSSTARYSMLLSDEDELLTDGVVPFLNYLETLDEFYSDIQVIVCSVLAENRKYHFLKYSNILRDKKLDISHALAMNILPKYMSGYVYRNSEVRSSALDKSHVCTQGNAYPHIALALNLLAKGYFTVFNDLLVAKGSEILVDNDDYYRQLAREDERHHCDNVAATKVKSRAPKANSYFYSAEGHARQFYFLEYRLNELKIFIPGRHYIAASLQHFLSMYISVALSEYNLQNSRRGLVLDCEDAYQASLEDGEFSDSFFAKNFRSLTKRRSRLLVFVAKTILKITNISVWLLLVLPFYFNKTKRVNVETKSLLHRNL
jgi:glycosyltransferase involved in cell wall biosynthesis